MLKKVEKCNNMGSKIRGILKGKNLLVYFFNSKFRINRFTVRDFGERCVQAVRRGSNGN